MPGFDLSPIVNFWLVLANFGSACPFQVLLSQKPLRQTRGPYCSTPFDAAPALKPASSLGPPRSTVTLPRIVPVRFFPMQDRTFSVHSNPHFPAIQKSALANPHSWLSNPQPVQSYFARPLGSGPNPYANPRP